MKVDPDSERDEPGSAIWRILRFSTVGLSGVFVNQGMLMLLHGGAKLPLLLASVIAIEISILTNFALNHAWTWRIPFDSVGAVARRAAKYHAAAVIAAFGANISVLMLGVEVFGADYRIANLMGIAVGAAINFVAAENWVFRPEEPRVDGAS